jgi:hypothetical protein
MIGCMKANMKSSLTKIKEEDGKSVKTVIEFEDPKK